MPLVAERPVVPNARGGQVYFSAEFLTDSNCPITGGEAALAQIVPHQAIVLLPERPEYPLELTLRDPQSIP